MNTQRTLRTFFIGTCAASAFSVSTSLFGLGGTVTQDQYSSASRTVQEGVEFLTRGPVHEAFADPVVFHAEAEFIISQAPPDPLEEIPPEEGVDGAVWIPGYWNWDDDNGDFIWISGFWRVLPPDMDWVPGYWVKVDRGYQWVGGFWKSIDVQEVAYLPEPPQVIDEAPYSDPPSENHIWVSGTWVWNENDWGWRPGYYVESRPGWIWSPAHYVWSPTGYIFIDGFWDYSVRRRGVLFAPAYFSHGVYAGLTYSPSVVVDTNLFVDHLFVHPGHGHYYFGDYYDYAGAGFHPWFEFHLGRYGYDPIFAYYNWHYSRHDRHWVNRLRDDFRYRRDHHDARPPGRFSEMQRIAERGSRGDRNRVLATSFDKFAARKDSQFKFAKLDDNRRNEIKERVKHGREFQNKRAKLESDKDKNAIKSKQVTKVKLDNSPLASVARERGSKEKPPEKPKTPDVDKNKEPGSREARSDRDRDRDRDRTQQAERDRARQTDRDRDTDRDRSRQAERERDRERTQQAERERNRSDGKAKADRTKAEQDRERAKTEQAKAKEDRRERGYTRPDDTSRQKADEPKARREEPRTKSDQPRPGSDTSRDRSRPQDRSRLDQPSPRSESDRSRQERQRADEARDRNKSDRARTDEQRDRMRTDRPKVDDQRDRDRMKTERSKVDEQRDRAKTDRPKTEQPRNRPDRPKADEDRERNRQERSKADEPRAKAGRSPAEDRQARAESRKEQAKPGRDDSRKAAERQKESAKPDRRKDSKDKDKDKDKDKKNP